MKRIYIIILFCFVFIVSGKSHTKVLFGTNVSVGISKVTYSDEISDSYNSNDITACFGIGIDGYYYFTKNFGMHFNLGYNQVRGEWDWAASPDIYKIKYNVLNLDIGAGFTFSGFFVDLDLSLNFKLMYEIHNDFWYDLENFSDSEANDLVFAIGATIGYRIDLGPVKIPVGVSFKYYVTTFISKIQNDKYDSRAWTLMFKTGVLF